MSIHPSIRPSVPPSGRPSVRPSWAVRPSGGSAASRKRKLTAIAQVGWALASSSSAYFTHTHCRTGLAVGPGGFGIHGRKFQLCIAPLLQPPPPPNDLLQEMFVCALRLLFSMTRWHREFEYVLCYTMCNSCWHMNVVTTTHECGKSS